MDFSLVHSYVVVLTKVEKNREYVGLITQHVFFGLVEPRFAPSRPLRVGVCTNSGLKKKKNTYSLTCAGT